jgi:hypothetical protein
MAAPEKLAALRHLLAERFPSALSPTTHARTLMTGIPAIDDATGGLPLSAVTEIVCAAPSCGGQLLIGELLARTRAARARVALVDGSDAFDPASFAEDLLAHLVWVRCQSTAQALQAVDLLARDANLALVMLDLRRATDVELRRVPATQWYRLQRAVEPTDLALLVETPRAVVASAQLRFVLDRSQPFTALEQDRATVVHALHAPVQRQRLAAAG